MKKFSIIKFGALLLPVILSSCTNYTYPNFKEDGNYKVGILLPVTHDALNNAADGFIKGLENGGWKKGENLEITIKNAEGKDDDLRTMAKSLIATNDLNLGLGTGATAQLKAAQRNRGTQNPILFSAVTDPKGAGFVKELETPNGLITGSSDAQPVAGQIRLVKQLLPEADKIGIFYTQSETNSEAQAIDAKKEIEAEGLQTIIKTCSDVNDLDTSFAALLAVDGLDAIYLPTDNNVAANMAKVKNAVKNKGVLVVGGEVGMLSGAHVTISVDYNVLGEKTGEMAAQILKGEKKPEDLPVYIMPPEECGYYFHSANLLDAGLNISSEALEEFQDVAE